jgi:hypothetical protein
VCNREHNPARPWFLPSACVQGRRTVTPRQGHVAAHDNSKGQFNDMTHLFPSSTGSWHPQFKNGFKSPRAEGSLGRNGLRLGLMGRHDYVECNKSIEISTTAFEQRMMIRSTEHMPA